MSLDEELLNISNNNPERSGDFGDSSDIASSLRISKQREKNKIADDQGDSEFEDEPSSLRQAVFKAKINQAKSSRSNSFGFNPIKSFTAKLLRSAWINLIPSWGLTMFYIDFHWFMNQVLGDSVVCKLGEEWLPAVAGKK